MNKRKLLIAAALLSALALLGIGLTSALLTDVEVQENVITIGRVSVSLDEGAFVQDSVVVPGSIVTKAPKLINDGNKDEFVFVRVTVPKDAVTLLYEQSDAEHLKGTARADQATQELFRFLCEDESGSIDAVPAASPLSFDEDFHFHNGSSEPEQAGWLLLARDSSGEAENVYTFGYNRKLAPSAETRTLFDKVQLKSFIDGETLGEKTIGVSAYAIQAENLNPTGSLDFSKAYYSVEDLQAILAIVEQKIAGSTA